MPAEPGHHALLYEDAGRFAGTVAAFAREGLHGGERVLAALTPEKLGWLREELGADADEVDLVDADVLYAQHGPMFSRLLGFLDDHASRGDGSARIVAEQALCRRPPEAVRAYMHYEAAMTVACADRPVRVLCPYDTARLPASVVEDALRTHPRVRQDDRLRPSPLFTEPRAFVRDRVERRPPPPEAQPYALEQAEDIAGARALARREAERGALSTRAGEDLALAISEIAANALVHGKAPRRIWVYTDDGAIVCQVRDAGPGLADPLAGYLPPDQRLLTGRGLWLAHQFCDFVEVASDAGGTDVYLRLGLPAAPPV